MKQHIATAMLAQNGLVGWEWVTKLGDATPLGILAIVVILLLRMQWQTHRMILEQLRNGRKQREINDPGE